jgi:hypothetical protein
MKRISSLQASKIAAILDYAVRFQDEYIDLYDGSTFPSILEISDIKVSKSGQFVTIVGGDSRYTYIRKERFNVNDNDYFSHNGAKALNHALNVILKAYKKHA